MYGEKDILKYLSNEMDANECKIYFVKENYHAANEIDESSYIELNIINSKYFYDPDVKKPSLASYCAIRAYELFNPSIWENKEGINIVFDRKQDAMFMKQYYFTLKELEAVSKAINVSEAFLSSLRKVHNRIIDFPLISLQHSADTLETKDSIEIANYFPEHLLEENKELVMATVRSYTSISDVQNSIKKYSHEIVTIKDSSSQKMSNIDYFKLNLSIINKDNEAFYIKFFFRTDNLNKIEAIQM
jgi:hypothetical protein